MINNEGFSISKVHSFIPPRNKFYPMTEAYTSGGVELGDTSQGWNSHEWKAYIQGNKVLLQRTDRKDSTVIFTGSENAVIEQIDICFDQTMNYILVMVIDGKAYLYNYKNAEYTLQVMEDGITYPRVLLDRTEINQSSESDVIIGYIKDNTLYYLVQREEFSIPHKVKEDPTKTMLWRTGRTRDNRIGFHWR